MDLRYSIPPLISLLSKLTHFQFELNWNQNDLLDSNHHFILKLAFLLLTTIVVLLFLLTSAKLKLNMKVTANPIIRLRAGDFSAHVALSLLCSIFLPPPHFSVAYFMIMCMDICPWQYGSVVNVLTKIYHWLRRKFRSIPDLNIICITQQEAEAEAEAEAPPQVEIELVEMARYPLQEQQGLGQDFVAVDIDSQ